MFNKNVRSRANDETLSSIIAGKRPLKNFELRDSLKLNKVFQCTC